MLLAGCGGDDENTDASASAEPVTTPLPTRSESATTTSDENQATTMRTDEAGTETSSGTESDDGENGDEDMTRSKRKRATSRSRNRSGSTPAKKKTPTRRGSQPDARASFIARGDAICGDYRTREREARSRNNGSKAEGLRYLDTVVSLISDSIRRLRALGRVPGDRAKFDAYVAELVELEDDVRRLRDATANEDGSAGEKARRVSQTSAEARRLAREYGFLVCGAE